MSTITAVLDPQPDGTLHLPLPEHLRSGKVKIVATLERTEVSDGGSGGSPLAALRELRKLNAFGSIADPVGWQREQRQDRPLPTRA